MLAVITFGPGGVTSHYFATCCAIKQVW